MNELPGRSTSQIQCSFILKNFGEYFIREHPKKPFLIHIYNKSSRSENNNQQINIYNNKCTLNNLLNKLKQFRT